MGKNRLLKPDYINQLLRILKRDGSLWYKTDHHEYFMETFGFIQQIEGVRISKITHDLYNSLYLEANIPSEFERLFISQ